MNHVPSYKAAAESATPLVSVCMTTYNHAPYLREAIEGVLMQRTPFDVELVLGEDCSTDGTADICREYAARYPDRVRLVTGPHNIGWQANYRRTVAACRGRYVAFCDGDDFWIDPDKLRLQVECLEREPQCDLCYTRTEKRDEVTGSTSFLPAGDASTTFDDLLRRYTIGNCATLARRTCVERYYDEVCPVTHHADWRTGDQPMWLWLAAHGGVAFIDRTTAVHRVLEHSVSHNPDYRRTIAFCDSTDDIALWFDARYGGGRARRWLQRRRMRTALWVLSYHGPVRDYVARWWCDVRRSPWLLFDPAPCVLLMKKILLRRGGAQTRNV